MSAPHTRPYNKRPYVEDDYDQSRRRQDRDVARADRRRGADDQEHDQRKRRAQEDRQRDRNRDDDGKVNTVRHDRQQQQQQQNTQLDDDDALDPDLTFELIDEEEEERKIQEQRRKRQQLMQQLSEHDQTKTTPSQSNTVPLQQKEPESQPQAPPQTDTSHPQDASAPQDISAADYDPSMDRNKASEAVADGIGEPQASQQPNGNDSDEYEEVEVEDDDDDVDDMFAIPDDSQPAKKKKKIIRRKKSAVNTAQASSRAQPAHNNLTDNWDDSEGYYRIVLGERIGPNSRYHVFANLGKGMFSEVVRAKDLGPDGRGAAGETPQVAIKIVRSQQTMYKAGQKEISILHKLSALDPQDKRHIVRLVSHFEHRGHLCMVFESLSMNLRDVVKRFGKDVGLNLGAVRAYTSQILLGLSLMRRAEIMHADLKPDNILVNDSKTVLKICDLGSATSTTDMEEITPYLVSRFYRAPEIILGGSYDCALDMWSIGCTLYELYTGKILFPGKTNNQMLLLIQELKGKFTTKQIRKGKFSSEHFDENNTFLSKVDVNGSTMVERITTLTNQPRNDLRSRLLPPRIAKTLPNDQLKATQHFLDLLSRMLELDPAKRITPNDALKHPFLAAA